MQLIDVALFLGVFAVSYAILEVAVRIIHHFTKDHSHTYRIAALIFALLFAGMVTYNNLGRSGTKTYPKILQRIVPTATVTPEPSPTPTLSATPTP